MERTEIIRKTGETDIKVILDPDASVKTVIDTGVGFLNHMLNLFAAHGRFGLTVLCKGDTDVDDHHSVEDIGIALGAAFSKALGDRRGIRRYGSCILPMDEALILAAVDFSGRANLTFDAAIPAQKVGSFDTELVKEFWLAFVRNAACSLHIREITGENAHHIIEGMFKASARAISEAVGTDPSLAGAIPSTKGVL